METGNASRDNTESAKLRISPLFNDAFLRIFGRQDSKAITRSLVNAVLGRAGLPPIGDVSELRSDAASTGGVALRTARTDVLVVSPEAVVDLEAERRHANVDNKMLFYASKLMCEHTPKGGDDNYSELPRIVVITLLEGRKLFEGDGFLSVGGIRWSRGNGGMVDGSDRMVLIVVELDKVRKRYTVNDEEITTDESLAWLYLLADGYRDDDEMGVIVERFQTMQEFAERYKLAMGDPKLKRAYDKYIEARMEYNEMVYQDKLQARREGHDEGYADGYDAGRNAGYDEGRNAGYDEGRKDALESMGERLRALGYLENDIDTIIENL